MQKTPLFMWLKKLDLIIFSVIQLHSITLNAIQYY